MKEETRNVLVGLTVLAGLALMGVMILLFAGMPALFRGGYVLRLQFPTTADAQVGDAVHLSGIRIGEITDIRFAGDDPRAGIVMDARVNGDIRIPANVQAYIYSRGFTGGAYIELKTDGPPRLDPASGQAMDFLPKDYGQPIQGQLKTGLIPDELKEAMSGVARLAENINKLLAPDEPPAPATGPAPAPATAPATGPAAPSPTDTSLRGTIGRLNRVLTGMEAVVGDAENQKNIKAALAHLAQASEQASAAMNSLKSFADEATVTAKSSQKVVSAATTTIAQAGHSVDDVARKLIESADKLGQFLTTLNQVASKLEKGDGSAGKFINDPALYMGLVDTARELNGLLKDLRALAAEWKDKGVPLKLK